MTYVLHYAPDNASIIIRLALEHAGVPYRTALVDRNSRGQDSEAFRARNPTGTIPVLETPQGTLFETAAILLWLADTHGGLGPGPDHRDRCDFLKWLFFLSNTPHASLRKMFYADRYIGPDHVTALRKGLGLQVGRNFRTLEEVAETSPPWLGAPAPTALDFYLVALLRWSALYPTTGERSWFSLKSYPRLHEITKTIEALPATHALQKAEGLGDTPFSDPAYPRPPEGSAV